MKLGGGVCVCGGGGGVGGGGYGASFEAILKQH